MLEPNSWFHQNPKWFLYSFVPVLGGLSLSYAGLKAKQKNWIILGLSLSGVSLLLLSFEWSGYLLFLVWVAQLASAFSLKKPFLIKTYPTHLPLPSDLKLAQQVAVHRPKLDINGCSKNDLVHYLGLPIVYANDIESLRNEGYIFTYPEELTEIIGVPESTVSRIAPLVVCRYDYRQEVSLSWRRLNTLSSQELVACGLAPEIAIAIASEREKRGEFRSLIDIKKRTGIPFSAYKSLA